MAAYHRPESSTCSLQASLGNSLSNMGVNEFLCSDSPATLSAPPTPAPAESPMMTMLPITNNMTVISPPAFLDPQDSSQAYCEFIYYTGFQQGCFSDICARFPVQGMVYAMHRIILVRSPMLYRRLMTPSSASDCHANILSINIPGSNEALHMALGHLYRPLSMNDIEYMMRHHPSTIPLARRICDLIQIAHSLELTLLQRQLIQMVQQHLNKDTMFSWMNEILRQHAFDSSQNYHTKPPKWIHTLDEIIVHFLTYTLPCQLSRHNQDAFEQRHDSAAASLLFLGTNPVKFNTGTETLLLDDQDPLIHLYARIPLLYLKSCLEHKDLLSRNVLWRYAFAKRVLCERERERKQPRLDASLAVVLGFHSDNSKNTGDDQSGTGLQIVMRQSPNLV